MLDFKQSVRARLGLGFVLIVVLMIALSGLAMRSIQQARDDTTRMYETYLIGVATLAQIRGMLADLNSDIRIALNSSGPADNVRNLSDRIQNTRAKLKADWRRYYPHRGASSEQRKIAGRADASLKRIDQALGRFAEQMADDSKLGAAGFYRTSLHKPLEQFSGQLTRLLARQNKAAALAHARSARSARNGQTIIVTATTIVIALGLLIMFYATRMVVRPLQETRGFVQRLANGNLERRQMTAYRDEFGVVLQAVESMRERLSGVVFDVRERSDSVSVGATEIASGNEELSHRTQAQAASLEQTAASMEQMTATVKQNADNAAQADELARDVRSQARKSSEVVGCAVRSMAAIDESSRKITDIIGLIDDIAFQTNLLALNASVEAARAGEQGRGFAVVAHEVRNLASRSAAAAKDIKTLVADSAAKVAEGSDNVASSGRALDEIEAAVAKVSDIVAEIAAASREQSAGIDQVNQAVSEMDSVTQQNASLVQESAAAGHALEEQARELRTRVDFFQLPGDENLALKIVEAKTSATAKATREHAPASRHTKVVTSTEAADQKHAWARF